MFSSCGACLEVVCQFEWRATSFSSLWAKLIFSTSWHTKMSLILNEPSENDLGSNLQTTSKHVPKTYWTWKVLYGNNQLLSEKHVELENDSIVVVFLWIEYTELCKEKGRVGCPSHPDGHHALWFMQWLLASEFQALMFPKAHTSLLTDSNIQGHEQCDLASETSTVNVNKSRLPTLAIPELVHLSWGDLGDILKKRSEGEVSREVLQVIPTALSVACYNVCGLGRQWFQKLDTDGFVSHLLYFSARTGSRKITSCNLVILSNLT